MLLTRPPPLATFRLPAMPPALASEAETEESPLHHNALIVRITGESKVLLELVGNLRVPIGLSLLAAVNGRMGARDNGAIALAKQSARVVRGG